MRRIFYFNVLVLVASLVFLAVAPASADSERDAGDRKPAEVRAAKQRVPSPGRGSRFPRRVVELGDGPCILRTGHEMQHTPTGGRRSWCEIRDSGC